MENTQALIRLSQLKDKSHVWLSKYGLSKTETEDIFQDSMLKAIKADNLIEDLSNLDGWFYRILTNTALDVIRKKKTITQKAEEIAEVHLMNAESEKEICGCVVNLMKELAPDDQELLKQHFYGNKTLKSISQELGVSESTLRVRALRARQKLKELFRSCCNPDSLEDLRNCEC